MNSTPFHMERHIFVHLWCSTDRNDGLKTLTSILDTKCTWTLTSDVLRTTIPYGISHWVWIQTMCTYLYVRNMLPKIGRLLEKCLYVLLFSNLWWSMGKIAYMMIHRKKDVDVKVQVHFVPETWRWRFEKRFFPVDHHIFQDIPETYLHFEVNVY